MRGSAKEGTADEMSMSTGSCCEPSNPLVQEPAGASGVPVSGVG